MDGIEEWTATGRRLALVDPDRFRRLLAVAAQIVRLYESESAVAADPLEAGRIFGNGSDSCDA